LAFLKKFVILYKMKKLLLVLTVVGLVACAPSTPSSNSEIDTTVCDSIYKDSLTLMDLIGVRQVVEMDKHPERY